MEKVAGGYKCPKCGEEIKVEIMEYKRDNPSTAEPVYVVRRDDETFKVNQICPKCGHSEAYRQVNVTIGEHAGVNSDRFVEKYRCAVCDHTWIKS